MALAQAVWSTGASGADTHQRHVERGKASPRCRLAAGLGLQAHPNKGFKVVKAGVVLDVAHPLRPGTGPGKPEQG